VLQTLIDLLSEDPQTRQAAVEALPAGEPAARFALRSALLGDADARVRGQAAAALASGPHDAAARGWLREGLADPQPSVREACLRGLARLSAADAADECAQLALLDPVWWVRRAALLAIAAVARVAAIPTLRRALGDPFWRVRHAAVQALALLADAHPDERARILDREPQSADDPARKPVAAAALWYLQARFDPSVDVHKFRLPERADEPLWNADPAVITARVRARPPAELDPSQLIDLLGDPHEPLRRLAAARLRARADVSVLRRALRHLEVPGMPHALTTTWALLDGLGERAQVLATEILADPRALPGALGWAASWTVRTACEELYDALAAQCRHPDDAARAAVTRAHAQRTPCPVAVLLPLLADPAAAVRSAAVLGLAEGGDASVMPVLRAQLAVPHPPAVRAAVVRAAARHGDVAALEAAAWDAHALPRSLALSELAHRGLLANPQAHLRDPDPWVRAAVLRAAPAAWLPLLGSDPDPMVRRRALQLALAHRAQLDADERAALAQAATQAMDAELRARGCALLAAGADRDLRTLLSLTRDPAPMVRAAAAAVLDGQADADARLQALLSRRDALSDEQRAAAHARLLRDLDEAAAARLAQTLSAPDLAQREPQLVCAQLRATALLFPELLGQLPAAEQAEIAALATPAAPRRRAPRPPREAPRRPLGRSGVLITPLVLSGAQELDAAALGAARAAGVNAFFWEPGYVQLTRFLRDRRDRPDLVLISGTYEGDRVGIERDVERALRRLRTDYLDVFLLFWTRSPERLSAEALATLRELKARGRIRAFGFSTHDRALAATAIATGDWDVVMTRHSAAHPGAEDHLLPLAQARGVGVLAFSALCYTRLLRSPAPRDEMPAGMALPTAPECYRYCLSQPGVSACVSAPRSLRELRENLGVLDEPYLPPARQDELRALGRIVRDQNRRFDALLRKGHEGNQQAPAPQQLGELLAMLMDTETAATSAPDFAGSDLPPPREPPSSAARPDVGQKQ
jgi:diketogulonate reductase-like aldo/keto reductase